MANNEVSMRFLQRFVVGLVLAAISLGGVAVAVSLVADAVVATMRAPPRAVAPREIVRRVPVVAFESTTQTPLLRAYGEVLSHRTLEVRAPVAGTVVALAPEFRTGGRVAAGQLLVQIDPVPAEAELAVAEADLAEAAADLRDARRSLALTREDLAVAEEQAGLRQSALARQNGLASRGVGTGAAVEEAALAAAAARQAVVARKQALGAAEARIDQSATRLTRRKSPCPRPAAV